MGYEHLRVERDADVVTITMARPGRRNSLSHAHLRELVAAFRAVGSSDAAGIVLAGDGPVFCSGHDLAEVATLDADGVAALLATCTELMQLLPTLAQVVIARVHGLATAAGFQLVAACDLAVASTDAGFALPGGKGGWFCHTPAVEVVRAVGRMRANELALTGDPIDAATAASWGLVNAVVPGTELDGAVRSLLGRATRGSRASKALGKVTLEEQRWLTRDAAYARTVEVMARASQTPAAREGALAFTAKRPAAFSD